MQLVVLEVSLKLFVEASLERSEVGEVKKAVTESSQSGALESFTNSSFSLCRE